MRGLVEGACAGFTIIVINLIVLILVVLRIAHLRSNMVAKTASIVDSGCPNNMTMLFSY